jgi:hypothetical protein
MKARKALLKKLAAVTDWESATRATLEGESWVETKNTLYRFRDGVCFAVACRDPGKSARSRIIVGMRLVGWLVGGAGKTRLAYAWEPGACAVLWRAGDAKQEEAMAMTSATTAFTRGESPACLQALHDTRPPDDSQTYRRPDPRSPYLGAAADAPRPRFPSSQSRSS